jgi:UDP-glucose:(heptosyl)LPS alpha-1,3-glucosyltransferase
MMAPHKIRLALVSPFLDKGYGTERTVIEWFARLADECEVHIYSQDVKDLDLSKVTVHRIPTLPGPHLFNFIWWFVANHLWRAWDKRFKGLQPDIVFSPGINCLDADVISVHIVFAEFTRRVRPELELRRNPLRFWPRLLHRRIYYALIMWLERRIYRNRRNVLVLYAEKTRLDLDRYYRRAGKHHVMYLGLDHAAYNPAVRAALRDDARRQLELSGGDIALLMIGNDWHKKGIRVLLEAVAGLRDLSIRLLIVGRDDPAPFREMVRDKHVEDRVRFLPPRKDVEFYYAAADIYVGPSLEDTFALPPEEAMSCGLPIIVSRENGAFEIVANGVDGLVLDDPRDADALIAMIRRLCDDKPFRDAMGSAAAHTAARYTWEQNARELRAIFEEIALRKPGYTVHTLTQES